MAATTLSHQQTHERRLSRAVQRARAARDRPTTPVVRAFFADAADGWRGLPRRLRVLASFLARDPPPCSRERLAAAVFLRAPSSLLDDFRSLFEALLAARQRRWAREHPVDAAEEDEEDEHDEDNEEDAALAAEEAELCRSLALLGWASRQLRRPLRAAIHAVALRLIAGAVAGNFEEEGLLERMLRRQLAVLLPWVHGVVGPASFAAERWAETLEVEVAECFVRVRLGELFDLVADYPDSLPAVRELGAALHRTGRLYQALAREFRGALTARLLHPGAETGQIIEVYISTVKVLREMDPSGELLQAATQPVRDYLKGRADTVRCIITSLTDEEGGGELYEELRNKDARPLEEAQLDEEDEEEPPTFDWEPPRSILERRGVLTGQVGRVASGARRRGDILSMLVGIYGSKDLFVNEYRIMLADKLLASADFDTDREVHNLELLKLRFGEASMRQCEVMIKDIDDSKRIQANIHSTLAVKPGKDAPPVVDAAIVSHIFWPTLTSQEITNHPRIQSRLDQFSIEYAKLKNPRRLVWMKQLGMVELEVEAYEEDEDGRLVSHLKEVSCSPAHATLLAHFEDQSEWTAAELAAQTGMSEDAVRKKMGFWVNQRVVLTRHGGASVAYAIAAVGEASDARDHSFQHDEDDDERAVARDADEEEETRAYESYVVGMLSNLGALPLERIHAMLRTFVTGSDHGYDKTPRQLAAFLQQLCQEKKLECSPDGLYTVTKQRS